MMYEIKNAKNYDGEYRVKFFVDNYFDLTVWYDADDTVYSFQLTYDKYTYPRALTWKKSRGFLHEKIDDGENPGRHKKTPVLMPDGYFRKDLIAEKFIHHSSDIDPAIGNFIYTKILSYGN